MKDLKEQFIEDGYLIFDNIIDEGTINNLRVKASAAVHPLLRKYNVKDIFELFKVAPQAVKNYGKLCSNLIELTNLMVDKRVLDLVRIVQDEPVIATKPLLLQHHKDLAETEGDYRFPAHQDQASVQQSLNTVIVWIPLVDIDDEIGPLEIAPGSHKHGACWNKIENSFGFVVERCPRKDWKKIHMNIGSVLMFSSMLIHRSGKNVSDRIRKVANFRYSDRAAKDWIARDYHNPYKYYPEMDENYRPSAGDMVDCWYDKFNRMSY